MLGCAAGRRHDIFYQAAGLAPVFWHAIWLACATLEAPSATSAGIDSFTASAAASAAVAIALPAGSPPSREGGMHRLAAAGLHAGRKFTEPQRNVAHHAALPSSSLPTCGDGRSLGCLHGGLPSCCGHLSSSLCNLLAAFGSGWRLLLVGRSGVLRSGVGRQHSVRRLLSDRPSGLAGANSTLCGRSDRRWRCALPKLPPEAAHSAHEATRTGGCTPDMAPAIIAASICARSCSRQSYSVQHAAS